MLKFSKLDFNSTWTMNFQEFKLDLEKSEEPEIKVPKSVGSSKKQDFPGGSESKASSYNVGELHSIPGLGRSPGEGNGNPL